MDSLVFIILFLFQLHFYLFQMDRMRQFNGRPPPGATSPMVPCPPPPCSSLYATGVPLPVVESAYPSVCYGKLRFALFACAFLKLVFVCCLFLHSDQFFRLRFRAQSQCATLRLTRSGRSTSLWAISKPISTPHRTHQQTRCRSPIPCQSSQWLHS